MIVASVQHVLVLVERGAVPFCSYESPHYHSRRDPQWMAEELLARFVRYAKRSKTAATFLFGKTVPPAPLARAIESIPHGKIVPLDLAAHYPDAVVVLDDDDNNRFAELKGSTERIVILRAARFKGLAALVEALMGKFRRLSLHLTAIPYIGAPDYGDYEDELGRLAKLLGSQYRSGTGPEVNVVSDRMMLTAMRNCGAGIDHLTLAPDGQLYLCPGFYHEYASAAGAFTGKKPPARIAIAELARAPICSRCDAFHCKRCLFLNRRMTGELTVPSEQQCTLAHLEREVSRKMLIELGTSEPFRRMPRIPELNYSDPLECIDLPPRSGDPASDPML